MGQFAAVLGALAGHGVGFDLSGPLGQQAVGFFETSQLLFDLTQVLLRVTQDHIQARIHVFEPSLDLGLRQPRLGQSSRLGTGCCLGRRGIQDLFGQMPGLGRWRRARSGARRFTALRPANLA